MGNQTFFRQIEGMVGGKRKDALSSIVRRTHSFTGSHVEECAGQLVATTEDSHFQVLLRGRSDYHLTVLKAVFIHSTAPAQAFCV